MNIVVDINHPAHVHFFKHFIWAMQERGHQVLITASDKDIAFQLLDEYRLPYVNLGTYGKSLFRKMWALLVLDYRMYRAVKGFNPDVILGIGTIRGAHVAWWLGKKSFVFDDTEHATEQIFLFLPFATRVYTPECFRKSFGKKQIRYQGYHELAYLHPSWFKPDPRVLAMAGLSASEPFFVVRFVGWDATHDVGQKGLSLEAKRRIIAMLAERGRVIITSEKRLPAEFESYRLRVEPTRIHDLLYYTALYIGESPTMATESALLGTPAVLINSWAVQAGNMIELERDYGLMSSFKKAGPAFMRLQEFLAKTGLKAEWAEKRRRLLERKIDVTQFMIDEVERAD
jgi:hypothetical protein